MSPKVIAACLVGMFATRFAYNAWRPNEPVPLGLTTCGTLVGYYLATRK